VGSRRQPFVTVLLLAALIALPALDVVCLAACEPGPAVAEAAVAHHVTADCHNTANSEARLESDAGLTCGDHDQALANADAVLRPGRDTAAPPPMAARSPTAVHLPAAASAAWSRQRAATLSPGSSRASLSVVLRI